MGRKAGAEAKRCGKCSSKEVRLAWSNDWAIWFGRWENR